MSDDRLEEGCTVDDYRQAPSIGSKLYPVWENKPHRLLYDLCAEVERLRGENAELTRRLEQGWVKVCQTGIKDVVARAEKAEAALREFTEAYRDDCERQGMIPDNNYRNMRLAAAYRAAIEAKE